MAAAGRGRMMTIARRGFPRPAVGRDEQVVGEDHGTVDELWPVNGLEPADHSRISARTSVEHPEVLSRSAVNLPPAIRRGPA